MSNLIPALIAAGEPMEIPDFLALQKEEGPFALIVFDNETFGYIEREGYFTTYTWYRERALQFWSCRDPAGSITVRYLRKIGRTLGAHCSLLYLSPMSAGNPFGGLPEELLRSEELRNLARRVLQKKTILRSPVVCIEL